MRPGVHMLNAFPDVIVGQVAWRLVCLRARGARLRVGCGAQRLGELRLHPAIHSDAFTRAQIIANPSRSSGTLDGNPRLELVQGLNKIETIKGALRLFSSPAQLF